MKQYSGHCAYRNCFFANNLHPNCPTSKYYSIIKEKYFQPTSTTKFERSLTSYVEVNNVSNFIAIMYVFM